MTLSLAKFNRIVRVDPVACTATVQSGVRNLAISEAAAPLGLYYAPDPSSQIACTIGGNVAENSGGVHCLKYGLTLHNVLQVRGYTVEGEAVTFGSEALDCGGLDLMAVLVGREGLRAGASGGAGRAGPPAHGGRRLPARLRQLTAVFQQHANAGRIGPGLAQLAGRDGPPQAQHLGTGLREVHVHLSLIHISEPTRPY